MSDQGSEMLDSAAKFQATKVTVIVDMTQPR